MQATQDLNNFNQQMVGNTQNTGIANSSTPGVFTGASSVNFLGTPNQSPTIVSNANIGKKIQENNKTFEQLAQPFQPKQPQVNKDGEIINPTQEDVNNFNSQYDTYTPTFQPQSYDTPEQAQINSIFSEQKQGQDEISKQILDRIEQKYKFAQEEQRLANQKSENNARMALGTLGMSGSPTDNNAYLNEIIQQGQRSLQKITNDEQDAYLEALKAKQVGDEKMFDKRVTELQSIRNTKIQDIQKFNERVQAQTDKMQEERKQTQKEQAIAEEYSKGTQNPISILANLKAKGISATAKQVGDVVALMSGVDGTGDIGQYNLDKSQGYTGSFADWRYDKQAQDLEFEKAKKQITNESGLTPQQNSSFERITTRFQADPVMMNAIKGKKVVADAEAVLANPGDATKQLRALYSFIKALDPDSVVREAEVGLAQQADSYFGKWNTTLDRISKGAVISPGVAEALARETIELGASWDEAAKRREQQYKAQAQGANVGEAFNKYLELSELPTSSIGEESAQKEQQAQSAVQTFIQSNPQKQTEYLNVISRFETREGRTMTNQELIQAFPEDFPNYQPKTGKGIVGGIDLNGYATDPNQVKSVQKIYNQVPSNGSVLDYDLFIKKVAPNSKVTGNAVLNVANKYALDPRIMIALMKHESNMGTSSVALANNNFGGITWSESYAKNNPGVMKGTPRPKNEGGYYVKFPSVEAGLEAQARLLKRRQIA